MLAGSVQVSIGTKTSLSFQDGPVFTRVHRREGPAAPRGSRARTHGTTISQPTWPGVPDRLHPAHGAGAGQQPFEILEDLTGYVATELNANPRDLDLYARRQPTLSAHLERVREHLGLTAFSQPALRTRIRRGLLKGEQLHALARCVHYGRLGRLDQRDFERQTGAASCLLLILAAIIYWQIREIDRVLSEAGSDGRTISTSSYCPISARSGGTTSSSTASTSSTAVSCEAKGLAYKFARFWALPSVDHPVLHLIKLVPSRCVELMWHLDYPQR